MQNGLTMHTDCISLIFTIGCTGGIIVVGLLAAAYYVQQKQIENRKVMQILERITANTEVKSV